MSYLAFSYSFSSNRKAVIETLIGHLRLRFSVN
jgi:hypothetical protein